MIARHTAYNLAGLGVPLIVAVFTIPILIHELGPARFGLLTLIWAVVSYFGLFDLGLGRALTQRLAVAWSRDATSDIGPELSTGLLMMAALGIVAAVALYVATPWAANAIRDVPDRAEAIASLHALSLAMPAIILTSGLRGVLEARRAFGIVNAIRLPLGLFTFLGPWAVITLVGPRLDVIAWVLCLGRVVGCVLHAVLAVRQLPDRPYSRAPKLALVRPLCVAGGWLTLSNVISPLMGYADRFVIGALVSAAAVALYATPQEVVTKLWIIPGALTSALFPAFAVQHATQAAALQPMFARVLHALIAAVLGITVVLALFAHELLSLWIGGDFADRGAPLLQIFSIGILVNSAAHIPFTLIQSAGHARLTALIHLIELPFFLVLIWYATRSYGLPGAALSWLLRMVVDTAAMFAVCHRLMGWPMRALVNPRSMGFLMLCTAGFAGTQFESATARAAWGVAIAATAALSVYAAHNTTALGGTLPSKPSTSHLDPP